MTRLESISIDAGDIESDDEHEEQPTRSRIIECIKASPNLTIRPADLSQQLGFSINDASAELCGLLQIVGQGSSFYFEKVEIGRDGNGNGNGNGNGETRSVNSMVFQFPSDFERKVLRAQTKDTFRVWVKVAIKALKVVTAFGLVVSIVIISIAMIVALIAALVTLSRGGGDSRVMRNNVSRKLRSLVFTIRQLLFCFAMLGPPGGDNDSDHQNHFFREAAYDAWLVMSVCCGNPNNIFFWWRAGSLRQRVQRRGWSNATRNTFANSDTSELESFGLLSRNNSQSDSDGGQRRQFPQRSLISSLVEFLFGPTTPSGTSNADKWRLRSAVILSKTNNEGGSLRPISLEELAPFVDTPPSSLNDKFQVVAEGLSIVSYFNGVPCSKPAIDGNATTRQNTENESKALFDFPELISESRQVWYDDPQMWDRTMEETKGDLIDFFYVKDTPTVRGSEPTSAIRRTGSKTSRALPKYLYEQGKTFSSLSRNQFFCCLLLTTLNFFGVIWFSRSLESGGILQENLGPIGDILKVGLVPVLWFYARLFVLIPTGRIAYVLIYNELCKRRNVTRKNLASELQLRDEDERSELN
eukprot:CAMPEP_0172368692 /NCGR_PEP_ID=MMETSP1060-20121228/28781_1 /TAXON_ID=37318 /ORGANISM="Pseudo-nitzschia pungens, Strain cf. cingulata" /LENGTH=583 /DNA_ID=CAMNT_0013093375 /DNA_START=129 /DNA_END=1880 /DNA_ORIENTATION=-